MSTRNRNANPAEANNRPAVNAATLGKQLLKETGAPELGIIDQILLLYKKHSFTRKQLIDAGYNAHTVHRQVHEFEQLTPAQQRKRLTF